MSTHRSSESLDSCLLSCEGVDCPAHGEAFPGSEKFELRISWTRDAAALDGINGNDKPETDAIVGRYERPVAPGAEVGSVTMLKPKPIISNHAKPLRCIPPNAQPLFSLIRIMNAISRPQRPLNRAYTRTSGRSLTIRRLLIALTLLTDCFQLLQKPSEFLGCDFSAVEICKWVVDAEDSVAGRIGGVAVDVVPMTNAGADGVEVVGPGVRSQGFVGVDFYGDAEGVEGDAALGC